MSKILVVVDMQNDFLTGSLANPDAVSIIPKIKELIAKEDFDWIVFTQDTHFDNYLDTPEGKALPVPHCISEEGWRITPEFDYIMDDDDIPTSYICKHTFGTTQLAEHLEGVVSSVDEVVFCGTCTDICVVSNALILKAMRPNIKIKVAADCCAGVNKAKHSAALTVMESCQIEII